MISRGCLVRSKIDGGHVRQGAIYLVVSDIYTIPTGDLSVARPGMTVVNVLGLQGAIRPIEVRNVVKVQ